MQNVDCSANSMDPFNMQRNAEFSSENCSTQVQSEESASKSRPAEKSSVSFDNIIPLENDPMFAGMKRPFSSPCPETPQKRSKRPSSVLGIEKNDSIPVVTFGPIDAPTDSSGRRQTNSTVSQSTESPSDKPNSENPPLDALFETEESISSLLFDRSSFLDDALEYAAQLCPTDCIVLVERCRPFNRDTVFMSHIRSQYLTPILTMLNGGPPLNADFGQDAYTSMYTLQTFSWKKASPFQVALEDTPVIYQMLKAAESLQFDERHGTAGCSTSSADLLRCVVDEFERMSKVRRGLCRQVTRHLVLLACSSLALDGETGLVEELRAKQIHLSLFSPMQTQGFARLYQLVNNEAPSPVYDRYLHTAYLSPPLQRERGLLGPMVSAYHNECQAKLMSQQHQQQQQQLNQQEQQPSGDEQAKRVAAQSRTPVSVVGGQVNHRPSQQHQRSPAFSANVSQANDSGNTSFPGMVHSNGPPASPYAALSQPPPQNINSPMSASHSFTHNQQSPSMWQSSQPDSNQALQHSQSFGNRSGPGSVQGPASYSGYPMSPAQQQQQQQQAAAAAALTRNRSMPMSNGPASNLSNENPLSWGQATGPAQPRTPQQLVGPNGVQSPMQPSSSGDPLHPNSASTPQQPTTPLQQVHSPYIAQPQQNAGQFAPDLAMQQQQQQQQQQQRLARAPGSVPPPFQQSPSPVSMPSHYSPYNQSQAMYQKSSPYQHSPQSQPQPGLHRQISNPGHKPPPANAAMDYASPGLKKSASGQTALEQMIMKPHPTHSTPASHLMQQPPTSVHQMARTPSTMSQAQPSIQQPMPYQMSTALRRGDYPISEQQQPPQQQQLQQQRSRGGYMAGPPQGQTQQYYNAGMNLPSCGPMNWPPQSQPQPHPSMGGRNMPSQVAKEQTAKMQMGMYQKPMQHNNNMNPGIGDNGVPHPQMQPSMHQAPNPQHHQQPQQQQQQMMPQQHQQPPPPPLYSTQPHKDKQIMEGHLQQQHYGQQAPQQQQQQYQMTAQQRMAMASCKPVNQKPIAQPDQMYQKGFPPSGAAPPPPSYPQGHQPQYQRQQKQMPPQQPQQQHMQMMPQQPQQQSHQHQQMYQQRMPPMQQQQQPPPQQQQQQSHPMPYGAESGLPIGQHKQMMPQAMPQQQFPTQNRPQYYDTQMQHQQYNNY